MTQAAKKLQDTFNFTFLNRAVPYKATYSQVTNKWVCSGSDARGNSYTAAEIGVFLADGTWKIVGAVKKLPSTFKFRWCTLDTIYTATEDVGGDYAVTWDGSIINNALYDRRTVVAAVEIGTWNILTEVPTNEKQDILAATNASQDAWKKHIEALDNDVGVTNNRRGKSVLGELLKAKIAANYVDDTQGETSNTLSDGEAQCIDCFGDCDECFVSEGYYDDITLLDFIKEFTKDTGASISVIDGSYTILYNDAAYNADCDCQLTEICNSITTLHLAEI